jgi:hypothetical protein
VPERERAEGTQAPRLRIAMLAPPWVPVPSPGYRGLEPSRCRQTAAECFAPDRVAVAYEAVYRETIGLGAEARPAARGTGAHVA